MIRNILKQKKVPMLGAFVDVFYTTLPLLGAFNFLSITVILYETIKPYILANFPWFSFWIFLGVLVLLTLLAMVVFYKFITPSLWDFRSRQMFLNNQELAQKFKEKE